MMVSKGLDNKLGQQVPGTDTTKKALMGEWMRPQQERVNRIWWECPALNKHSDLGYLNLHKKRAQDNNKP
eukprot:44527-Heterocapsa_arctica.AAC.1